MASSRTGAPPANGKPKNGLRALLAAVLVIIWLAVAGIGGPTFGKLSDVQSNDQAAFLPASAEATRALEWQEKFRTSDAIPAVVVVANQDGWTPRTARPWPKS